jgi:chaperonin GroES
MSLQPIRDFIVVSIPKEEEKIGLIYKPATVEERITTGKVLSVGSGHLTDQGTVVPLEVKVGDMVVFNKQMAVEVKHAGESFWHLREEHILSIAR